MTEVLDRRRFLAGATLLAASGGRAQRAAAAAPTQIAFVYIGPVGDFGWTYQHDQARIAVQQKFGDAIKANYVESVSEGPDCLRVFRQLAEQGNRLIFGTTFGYMNFMVRAAKEFPDVRFEHATGYKTTPNLATYNGRFHEGRTVCGTIAGIVSKTKSIGYIASFPIPEVVMGINAFTLAARAVEPAIRVKVIWINGWFDPGKESDAAKSLIDQGADILVSHTDSPAVTQTAETRGVFSFGQDSDMSKFGPKAQLSAVVDHWTDYYASRTQAVLDGSWQTGAVWYGLKEGLVALAPWGPGVTPEARAAAERVKAGLIEGSLNPFPGPIVDNKGAQRLAVGGTLGDADLLKMDWFVEGVQA